MKSKILFFFWLLFLHWSSFGGDWQSQIEIYSHLGFSNPLHIESSFDEGIADVYGSNWGALRVSNEHLRAWDRSPALFGIKFNEKFSKHIELQADLPLRRDFESWHQSTDGSTLITEAGDLDINVPYEGWISAHYKPLFFKVGRFAQTWSDSPDRGVILNGAPWHDGALTQLEMPVVTLSLFVSSLDARLNGTPQTAGGAWPWDSEEEKQRTLLTPNQHRRIYDDPFKSLIMHRADIYLGKLRLGLSEQVVIGGKALALRDFSPLMAWHNNYGDGFSNSITSLDFAFEIPNQHKFYGEFAVDEIKSEVGETLGNPNQTNTLAWMLGYSFEKSLGPVLVQNRFDVVHTDALYGNHQLPLLKHSSRRMIRSNYREQGEPGFIDTYVVDQPLGYWRGPGAMDFWWDLGLKWKRSELLIRSGLLFKGETSLEYPMEQGLPYEGLMGETATRKIQTEADYIYSASRNLSLLIGAGYLKSTKITKDEDPLDREHFYDYSLKAALKYSFLMEN
jgi:hypothetical protein